MRSIVILYPEAFTCYSKFNRKVSNILDKLDDYTVVYPHDANDFITKFFTEHTPRVNLVQSTDWRAATLTHGIIFDDGEEFVEEMTFLNSLDIPLRTIRIAITRVINIKKDIQYQSTESTSKYEYIGRGSYWGNPYSMFEEGDDRKEVIRKYKYDFNFEKFPNKDKAEVYKLAGKRLGCFCSPQTCHGDVLADYLNSWDDGK